MYHYNAGARAFKRSCTSGVWLSYVVGSKDHSKEPLFCPSLQKGEIRDLWLNATDSLLQCYRAIFGRSLYKYYLGE